MKPEITDKIERYLNNEMQPQELSDFELELSKDEELRRSLELYRFIDTTMRATEKEKELRQSLQQMNRKYFAEGGNVKQGQFKKWLAAAAAVLVIVLGIVYFLSPGRSSTEELYAEFAQAPALNIQMRGTATDSLAQKAAAAFNNKNYRTALPLIQAYLQQQPQDIQMTFSEAICYLETGNYREAEDRFMAFLLSRTAYAETAKWWMALSSLKQKDYNRCRNNLNNITQESPYYNKAQELLKKLPN